MFEREVKFIYDFSSTKVKKLGATATYSELVPLNLHPAIMKYIAAEIEYRVYEDRQTLLKHSMFDYSGKEITKHFKAIADEIKKEKRFSTDFLNKVVLHATSFNVNHLIRPNWSLKKLIFDTGESNGVDEISQILNYSYFYSHVPNVLKEYFEKKKLITMDKEAFGELLTRVDKASFEQYGNELLLTAIKAMASFFNIGSMHQTTVPLQAIGVYLNEKQLRSHLEKLEKELRGETKSKIELNDLRQILFDVQMQLTETMSDSKVDEEESVLEEREEIKSEPAQVKEEDPEEELIEDIEEDEEDTKEEELYSENYEKEDEEEIEKEFDEDVDIILRANKEKEILGTEDDENEDEKVTNTDEVEEEIPIDHLVQETENKSDIILTPEEEDHLTELDEPEETFESSDQEEIEKAISDDDEIEEIEVEEDPIEMEIVDDNLDSDDDVFEEEEPLENKEEPTELFDESLDEEKVLDVDDLKKESEVYDMDSEDYDFNSLGGPNEYSYPELGLERSREKSEEENTTENEEEIEETENEFQGESEEDLDHTTLFGDLPDVENEKISNDIADPEEKEDFITGYNENTHAKRIDIADLLENKNMTKIIAVVFDYDMEEFANAIEKICDSSTSNEAFTILNEIYEINDINPSSKEAQSFREIIAEYFEQN